MVNERFLGGSGDSGKICTALFSFSEPLKTVKTVLMQASVWFNKVLICKHMEDEKVIQKEEKSAAFMKQLEMNSWVFCQFHQMVRER